MAGGGTTRVGPPELFLRAAASARSAVLRAEVVVTEIGAPQRLAPQALALSGDVLLTPTGPHRPGAGVAGLAPTASPVPREEAATGRLVLLHDPAAPQAWHGVLRVVAYVRAALEAEMAMDPLLPAVGWAWLTEALEDRRAAYTAASGTVTRVTSETFGGMAEDPATAEIEIRASWTPLDAELASHVQAWGDVLCAAAGLAPLPAGVVPIPASRGGHRR